LSDAIASILVPIRIHRWSVITAALLLVVYVAAFASIPKDVFWSPDEGIKFIMTEMVHLHPGIEYDLPYKGEALDPEFRFYPGFDPSPDPKNIYPFRQPDGSIRLPWPIWFPLLSSFLYHSFGISGVYLLPLACGWLTAILAARLTSRFEPSLEPWSILLVGLGTPVWFFSLTFWEHTFAALLAMIIMWLVIVQPWGRSFSFISAFLVSFGMMMIRIELIAYCIGLFAAGLLIQWLLRGKPANRKNARPIVFFAPALAALLFVLTSPTLMAQRQRSSIGVFAQIALDNAQELESSTSPLARYVRIIPDLLINSSQADSPFLPYPLAWGGVVAFLLCFAFAPTKNRLLELAFFVPALIFLLVQSAFVAFMPLPYRSLHGILLLVPYGALATFALRDAYDHANADLLFLTSGAMTYLALGVLMLLGTRVDAAGNFVAGLEWGQRYLLPLYPLLAILALVGLHRLRRSAEPGWLRQAISGIVVLMMVIGIDFQIRGVLMLNRDRQNIAGWQRVLETQATGPVVTNLWWLPASLAYYYSNHEMYLVNPENANAWLDLAKSHKLYSFTYASQVPWSDALGPPSLPLHEENSFSSGDLHFTRMAIAPDP
jgi:hypothetical protein